jgi:ESS family glutamate:Na+ symporter
MTTGSNFWDLDVWSFVIVLSILFIGMLAANLLRRRIPFLRKSLIPSSVLGGFLILLADWAFKAAFGHSMFNTATLEALTFHGLGLGFVALAWRKADGRRREKTARRDVFSTSTVVVGSYLLQGIIGLTVTIPLFYLVGSYAAGGILLPMGYGQGPGQALNWGTIYQNYTMYPAFENGASFGLTVAAMGFVSASIGGVYYLNRLRRAGDKRAQVQNAEEIEDLNASIITEKGEIPLSESMDKLTVQVAIVFATYFIAFAAMWYVTKGLDSLGGFWVGTVKPLLWGFNFLVGTAFAILFKNILTKLRAKGVVHRDYINNFMLNRISGLFFDVMVTASIAAISLEAFKHKEFILPLVLICIAGAVITYWYNISVCRVLFPDYSDEAFLSLYGMNTGTASTGIILLREIDPLFETPASHNLIYQNLWSIVLGAPMLMLLGFVARSMTWTWIVYGILYVLFGMMLVIQYRSKLFKKKRK